MNRYAEDAGLWCHRTAHTCFNVLGWPWVTAVIVALALLPAAAPACGLSVGSGATVTLSGTLTVDCVDVAKGGTIVLQSGGTLVLTGAKGNDTSTVNGCIVLEECDSVLRITSDHTFTGDGCIRGECNTALVTGMNLYTLTIRAPFMICGALTMAVDFVNNGTVRADEASSGTCDTLLIDSGTITGNGSFEVVTAGAWLEFDATGVDATGLYTYFTLDGGTLDCETDVTSTRPGCFSAERGSTVYVGPGLSVIFY
jgi:hypothetical protein